MLSVAGVPALESETVSGPSRLAMGKMRNCGMWNAEVKMRNGMCGATVIGRDVTSRTSVTLCLLSECCTETLY